MNSIKTYQEDDSELLYLIEDNNEDAKELIYKRYSNVISYYSKKYYPLIQGKGLDEADLYQEGMLGLHEAINHFKEQKDIKFSTFAFICIKRKIITALRNASRKKYSILNNSLSIDYKDDNNLGIEDSLYMASESIEDLLVSKENDKLFKIEIQKTLSPFERSVYELKINGFTNEEISGMLNKSYKAIESSLSRIRAKLRNVLNKID